MSFSSPLLTPSHAQIFFDNERRNCRDVAALGVVCIHTPDGMTKAKWEAGLAAFAKAKAAGAAAGSARRKKSKSSRKK